jgi:CheY-like chemotaxis protein
MAAARVLVIDDSPTIVRVVQLVLTKAGFTVEAAADGEAGLAAARAHRPDLILLDFVMPKMNGYQVCRELAADAGLRDVPVVLMSAKGDQVGERFVKVMGIVDYITKPFSPEAITAVVQHTVAKYQGADAPRTDAITAADLADGGAGRGRALAALRGVLTDRGRGPGRGAVRAGRRGRRHRRRARRAGADRRGAIADTVRSALDDDALGGVVARLDPALFDGEPPARRPARDPAGRGGAAARSPGAVGRADRWRAATPPASTSTSAAAGSIRPWASGWPTICGSAATSSTAS